MSDGHLPHSVVWLSILIIVYSVLCLLASLLLVTSLLVLGEKYTYITLIVAAVSVGTLASIIQQIHFAIAWVDIKEAQYVQAKLSITEPGLQFGGPVQFWDVVLFYIQFYTYNLEGLLTLFWAIALFKSTWNLQISWLSRWEHRMRMYSKLFALVAPAIVIVSINIPLVRRQPVPLFVLTNFLLFTTPILGSVLLVLILSKYIKTRSRIAENGRKLTWWTILSLRSANSQVSSSSGLLKSNEGFERLSNQPVFNRSLIIRFSVGFVFLIGFEISTIVFNLVQINHTSYLASSTITSPDFSISNAKLDLVLFIPGVTVSLIIFLVFGTARRFLPIYKSIFLCRSPRRASKDIDKRPVIKHLGQTVPPSSYFANKVQRTESAASGATNGNVRNFNRPTNLILSPIESFTLAKAFRPMGKGNDDMANNIELETSGATHSHERTKSNQSEPDLMKPLPHTPSAKFVRIGLEIRKSAWDGREVDENEDDFIHVAKMEGT